MELRLFVLPVGGFVLGCFSVVCFEFRVFWLRWGCACVAFGLRTCFLKIVAGVYV